MTIRYKKSLLWQLDSAVDGTFPRTQVSAYKCVNFPQSKNQYHIKDIVSDTHTFQEHFQTDYNLKSMGFGKFYTFDRYISGRKIKQPVFGRYSQNADVVKEPAEEMMHYLRTHKSNQFITTAIETFPSNRRSSASGHRPEFIMLFQWRVTLIMLLLWVEDSRAQGH